MPPVESDFSLTPQDLPGGRPVEIVVVGRDALGIDICRGLMRTGRRVAAVWPPNGSNLDDLEQLAVDRTIGDGARAPVLTRAGIRLAHTVVAVSDDDQFNLRVALAARDLNPGIRVVLRQFNRRLGQKIVHQLDNCEAVSPETHSAATFAASCLNRWVYQALEFPLYSEELVVFCRGPAEDFGAAGATVADLLQRKGWQVLAVDDLRFPSGTDVVRPGSAMTISCRLDAAPPSPPSGRRAETDRASIVFEHQRRGLAHALRRMWIDPIILGLSIAMTTLVLAATAYFHSAGLTWVGALYHVANTVTTTGREANELPYSDATRLVEIALDIGSVAIVGILLAYVTAAITSRSIELSQGRHRVRASGHIIVCGFGNVGSRVVRYLLNQERRVVVIDRKPDAVHADLVRARGAHVMTADATTENTLEMASVREAAGLLALTDSDSVNLEIALTAGAYAPDLPVIMRIAEHETAKAVERHFRIRASYSTAALAAPLITGIALERGSRGTVDIAGTEFSLVQRRRSDGEPADGETELAAEADDLLVLHATS